MVDQGKRKTTDTQIFSDECSSKKHPQGVLFDIDEIGGGISRSTGNPDLNTEQINEGTAQGPQEEGSLSPESQKIINEIGKVIETGNRETVLEYIEMLIAVNRDLSGMKPEKSEMMTLDWFFESFFKILKVFLPEAFWLKMMINHDQQFLIGKATLKALNQGLQINIAGKYIIDPPGEKKGRIYLPPKGNGTVNPDKTIMMVRKNYPVRTQRLLRNRNRLAELKGD